VAGLEIPAKRELHIWRWLFSLVLVIALAACAWYAYRWYTTGEEPPLPILPVSALAPKVDESAITPKQLDDYRVPATHPRYISIPSIGVTKSRVLSVGENEFGNLETPYNLNDTAWYNKSATPGTGYGAVMIDGHNGGYSKDGIFAKLSTIQTGALITIERGDGKTFSYKVVSNQTMSLDEANKTGMQTMTQSADPNKEGLSLITCAGNYVPKLGQFDKRVMVRAVRTDS